MSNSLQVKIGKKLQEGLARDIESKLSYVSEAILSGRVLADEEGLHYVDLVVSGPDEKIPGAVLKLVQRMSQFYRPIPIEVLWQSPPRARNQACALAELEAQGEVARQGAGIYALGPQLTRLKRLLEDDLDVMARTMGAQLRTFPTLMSLGVLEKCGYFSSFPHHLNFAVRSVRDIEAIEGIGGTGQELRESIKRALVAPEFALQPNLCFHCYAHLEGEALADNLIINCQGTCFRHEGIRFSGLDRLYEFTMRELVFVGEPDFVLASRARAIELGQELVDRWDLEARIETATDPFFINAYPSKRFYQLATKAKYELLAPMPAEGRSLAIASFNIHGDFFAKPFAISRGEQGAHTGCVGYGLERWVYAFLAQHGVAPEGWPLQLQRRLG